jgi:NAD(P)-dependent dehydrogenase (short-subunit alcohol dehydrogenase family)
MRSDKRSVFVALSARVGSISDNYLGGWYSYRASKAALNMVVKSASIEMARSNKYAIVAGLHPGTVATNLSNQFLSRVRSNRLFSSEEAASKLIAIIENLSTDVNGKVVSWDGSEIPS